MSKVAIITERLSSLSYDFADKHNITLLPANVIQDEKVIKDDSDEKANSFLKSLDPKGNIPSTSTSSIGEVFKLFQEATKDTDQGIYISSSPKLTAFHDVGVKAAKLLKKQGKNIQVFNSNLTLSAIGMMAYEASQLSENQGDVESIMQFLTTIRDEHRITEFGVIETLKFLVKNGRIGKAKAWLANIFSFKPIISIKDGELDPVTRVRTNDQALETLVRLTREKMESLGSKKLKIMFDYGISDEYIQEKAQKRFKEEFDAEIISINQISIAIGCHLGPNIWGLALYFV